jgi:hypothetical protein
VEIAISTGGYSRTASENIISTSGVPERDRSRRRERERERGERTYDAGMTAGTTAWTTAAHSGEDRRGEISAA